MQKKKIIIIGSGIAGIMAANLLKDKFIVTILTKQRINDSNSMLAQGGIAVALDKSDSCANHYEDSMIAGCFYNDKEALRCLVTKGPEVLQSLIDLGLEFDKNLDGSFSYGLEGAHKIPRILHIGGDKTGKKMTEFIFNELEDVIICENTTVVEILSKDKRCFGVKLLDANDNVKCMYSDYVILATGGIGRLFPLTTNVETITGDGIAMAQRAGCELKDMEFIQFHPTLLSIDDNCYGLISEAVRGEGAFLVRNDGSKIMKGKHKYEDLAPRDIVSREITKEIQVGEKVFLDISNIPNFIDRFPAITENLKKHGIPFEQTKRIPVHPGAHFFMGGIKTDLNGETSVKNLFALGETSCTGVHGANRLASNSLLEAIVFADSASKAIISRVNEKAAKVDLDLNIEIAVDSEKIQKNLKDNIPKLPELQELQKKAWNSIGINRSEENINKFLAWLSSYDFYSPLPDKYLSRDRFECQNLCLVAYLVAKSALNRKESLGAHYLTKGTIENEFTFGKEKN